MANSNALGRGHSIDLRVPKGLLIVTIVGLSFAIPNYGLTSLGIRGSELCAILSVILLWHGQRVNRFRFRSGLSVLFLFMWWCWLSIYWAEDAQSTLLALKSQATVVVVGIMAASLLTADEILASLSIAFRSIIVIALACQTTGLTLPVDIDDPSGAGWVGQMISKNGVGFCAAASLVLLWFRPMRRWVRFGWTALALLVLIQSRSSTALVATIVSIAVVRVLRRFVASTQQRRRLALLVGAALTALSVLVLRTVLDTVPRWFGKNPTLSGRAGIWSQVLRLIDQRAWLGYGFGSIWGHDNRYLQSVTNQLGFQPANAHNLWLDVLLQTGYFGLLGVVLVFAWTIMSLWSGAYGGRSADLSFLALFVIICVTSMTESVVFINYALLTVVIVVARASDTADSDHPVAVASRATAR